MAPLASLVRDYYLPRIRLAALTFGAVTKRNIASWVLPSDRVSTNFRQLPHQVALVFQT